MICADEPHLVEFCRDELLQVLLGREVLSHCEFSLDELSLVLESGPLVLCLVGA